MGNKKGKEHIRKFFPPVLLRYKYNNKHWIYNANKKIYLYLYL